MNKNSLKSLIKTIILEAKQQKKDMIEKKSVEEKKVTSEELVKSLSTTTKKINNKIKVFIDDHKDIRVELEGSFYVRIRPNFVNNFNVEAYRNLTDRVYAVGLTTEQVKEFVKTNFGTNKDTTVQSAMKKVDDNREDATKKAKGLPQTNKPTEKEVDKKDIEKMDEKGPEEVKEKSIEKQIDHGVEKSKNMAAAKKMSTKKVDDDLTKSWKKAS